MTRIVDHVSHNILNVSFSSMLCLAYMKYALGLHTLPRFPLEHSKSHRLFNKEAEDTDIEYSVCTV